MRLNYLDKEEFNPIPMYKMIDNKHGDLPFYFRKYATSSTSNIIHRHEYLQINYIMLGKGMHLINGNAFEIIKGDIFVIPPYIPHAINAQTDSPIEIIEFEFVPEFINQSFENDDNTAVFFDFAYIEPFLVSENQVKPRLNLKGIVQQRIESILNNVMLEYNIKSSGYILFIKALLLELLVIVGREFECELKDKDSRTLFLHHRDAIYGALQYISDHYNDSIAIEDIAKRFAFSQSYFSYLFKCITKETFVEYLNRIRISKAMGMLSTTDKRVIDICFETGFRCVNHFNRVFHQHSGISPNQYRKRLVI